MKEISVLLSDENGSRPRSQRALHLRSQPRPGWRLARHKKGKPRVRGSQCRDAPRQPREEARTQHDSPPFSHKNVTPMIGGTHPSIQWRVPLTACVCESLDFFPEHSTAGFQRGHGRLIVILHQTRVARDIGGENRFEFSSAFGIRHRWLRDRQERSMQHACHRRCRQIGIYTPGRARWREHRFPCQM